MSGWWLASGDQRITGMFATMRYTNGRVYCTLLQSIQRSSQQQQDIFLPTAVTVGRVSTCVVFALSFRRDGE